MDAGERLREEALRRWRALHRRGRPGKLEIDPEVRAFVDEGLSTMTFEQLARACRERFGRERAASRSVIHRYWQQQCAECPSTTADPGKGDTPPE